MKKKLKIFKATFRKKGQEVVNKDLLDLYNQQGYILVETLIPTTIESSNIEDIIDLIKLQGYENLPRLTNDDLTKLLTDGELEIQVSTINNYSLKLED